MITVNGKKFARNDAEFTDTLFEGGGTACGFYKVSKRGGGKCITLRNMQGTVFAAIIGNKHNEQFFVSAHEYEGRVRYMYGLSSIDKDYLALPENLRDQSDLASLALAQV